MNLSEKCLIALVFLMNTFVAPAVKLTQTNDKTYEYNTNVVYFLVECFKCGFAGCWCVAISFIQPKVKKRMVISRSDILMYSVPGFVFFAQNNLSFVALKYISNAGFNLLMNLRIVVVALLTTTLLQKQMNAYCWIAVFQITIGAIQFQLSKEDANIVLKSSTTGIASMMSIVTMAGGGNVATQYLMQKNETQPLMFQNFFLYIWGVFFNGLNLIAHYTLTNSDSSYPIGFTKIITPVKLLCLFNVFYGLCISFVLKRFGAMIRTLISCMAIISSSFIDALYFNESVTHFEVSAYASMFCGIYLYAISNTK